MRIPLSATLAAAAVLAVAPAAASARDIAGVLTATGGVSITFSGDPARGCTTAGLCGYSGSVDVAPHKRRGEYLLSFEHGRMRTSDSYVTLKEPAAVVVHRSEGGAEAGTCSDQDQDRELYVYVIALPAKRGRSRFALASPDLSTGRCAGPAIEQALARLPTRTVPLKQVSRGNATLDMSGQSSYHSGRFTGTVTSTLRFHLGRAGPGTGRIRAPRAVADQPPLVRVASVRAVYRIVRYSGEVDASFSGLTGPPCADLDSCGVNGSVAWKIDASGGEVSVDAAGRARRSDHGLRGALAAIRRRGGYVDLYAQVPYVFGTTTADVSRPGGTPCHDAVRAYSPGIDAGPAMTVELGGPDSFAVAGDMLRAGCPGPRDFDAFRYGRIAAGHFRLASLARRRFTLELDGKHRLRGPGYSGSATARITLRLKRRSLRVDYRRSRYVLPP